MASPFEIVVARSLALLGQRVFYQQGDVHSGTVSRAEIEVCAGDTAPTAYLWVAQERVALDAVRRTRSALLGA